VLITGGVDLAFAGLLRFDHGVLGSFDSGFHQQFYLRTEVAGSQGSLTIERPFPITSDTCIVIRIGSDDSEEEITVATANPYQCEVETLTAAVLDGAALPVPLQRSGQRGHVGCPVRIGTKRQIGSGLVM
jgi:hypothetical protein